MVVTVVVVVEVGTFGWEWERPARAVKGGVSASCTKPAQ